jgi:hypothetical protein
VEALDVAQVAVPPEEAVEGLEDVPLLLLTVWREEYRWNLVMLSKVFMLARARSASFWSCS